MNPVASAPLIPVYGHISADPLAVAQVFDAHVSDELESEADCAIFVINPSTGIDQKTIEMWQAYDEYLVPRIVVVTHIENPDADFDDAVLLANRVFDYVLTPYLVLHDEAGLPCALISLESMQVIDYSTAPPQKISSEPEHETLVQEFRDEYLEHTLTLGEDAFIAGLLFPAIPVWIEKGIGIDIVYSYLNQIKR